MFKVILILMTLGLASQTSNLYCEDAYRALESLVVQEGGRKKPFLTFAQEELTLIHGRASWRDSQTGERLSAMHVVTQMWAAPERWANVPLVLVDYRPLKEQCGLDVVRRHFSLKELAAAGRLWEIAEEANQLRRRDQNAKVSSVQQKALDTAKKAEVLNGLLSGELMRVVPNPDGASARWGTLSDLTKWYGQQGQAVLDAAGTLLTALAREEASAEQSNAFKYGLRGLKPDFFPDDGIIDIELAYVHWHPFRLGWMALITGLVAMALIHLMGWRWGHMAGVLACSTGLGLLVWGMVARVLISGRAPVTNMYETIVWLALGILIFALAFECKHRCGYYFWSSFPVAILALMMADSAPTVVSPALEPLVAVLRSNFWLTVHVMTIVTSYSAFAVSMGVAHIVLWNYARGMNDERNQRLTKYVTNTMHLGVWLLGTGIVLGAVWANYSWGRFWDWDPKETFSLVAFLGYLVTLHGRLFRFWKGVGVAAGSVLSFQLVLVAWYGVNYILAAGLHSYGFGSGNHTWFYALICAEVAYVIAAIVTGFIRRQGGVSKKSLPAYKAALDS